MNANSIHLSGAIGLAVERVLLLKVCVVYGVPVRSVETEKQYVV